MNDPPLMKREKVEHILRAAGAATGRRKFVLIGSAAVVAWRDVLPPELAMSRDIDLFAYDAPDADAVSDQLDGALGQASNFDETFGYYCDGVGPETAKLPANWEVRTIEFASGNTNAWWRLSLSQMTLPCPRRSRGGPKMSLGCARRRGT